MIDLVCDECGASFKRYPSQVHEDNNYCSKKCQRVGSAKTRQNKSDCICDYCSQNYKIQPSKINKDGKNYCSKNCQNKSQEKSILVECDGCDESIKRPQSEVKENGNYCSHKCYSKSMEEKVSFICTECGKESKRHPSKFNDNGKSFCSEECQYKWQSGENHPSWKGGYDDYYGYTWKTRRKDIQKRDGNICQLCNFDSNETLDVHHIVPVRKFDDPNNAHFEENIYQLCKECHLKMEKVEPIKQKKLLDDGVANPFSRIEELVQEV